jgi:hypothetical protein
MAFRIIKPIEEQKTEAITKIKQLSSDRILSNYPIYRQLNISRLPYSEEAILMFSLIDGIRNASNTAESGINSATTITEIRGIVSGF